MATEIQNIKRNIARDYIIEEYVDSMIDLHSALNIAVPPGRMYTIQISNVEDFLRITDSIPNAYVFARPTHTDGEVEIMTTPEVAELMQRLTDAETLYAHRDDEIREIGIDIETYSPEPLKDCGVYRYAEHDDFEILLFAYSINGLPVQQVDLACGEKIPDKVLKALTDPKVLKTAFNASFERVCLSRYLGEQLQPEQWDCTKVRCARLSLPLSLGQAAKVLKVVEKMEEGKALIQFFSCPCRPTKKNGGRTRNYPEHDEEKWKTYKRYNVRDVETEQALRAKVTKMEMPTWERRMWYIDQHINDRGVLMDMNLVNNANRIFEEYTDRLKQEAKEITNLENTNSVAQLKDWLGKQTGMRIESLNKKVLPDIKANAEGDASRILDIRAELGKTSCTKYAAMQRSICKDNRIRGLLEFCGAVRTGRWAGRLVQVQNLPQNHIPDLDTARNIVKGGDLDELEMNYGNVPATLSELIRTSFIAKPGRTFHVCDFSAIEARVISWLADEQWAIEVFKTSGKIYEAAAAQMYHVPMEEITKTDPRRQKGKIATLALGYQGGVGALKAMGGDRMGLTDPEMQQIVEDWRRANPHIVRLWKHVEDAAKCTARTREKTVIEKGISMEYKWGGLLVTLPSGRPIYYPRIGFLDDGRLRYEGLNQTTHKWEEVETYGGKMTENLVQAIARDCLALTMQRLEDSGYEIVFHIHDECIVEARPDQTLEQIEEIFKTPIPWAEGLPLKGAGYTTPYYLKD